MKNKRVLFGLLAVTLVFAMTAVGCDDSADDKGGGGLTITGLGTYNGKYVIGSGTPVPNESSIMLYAAKSRTANGFDRAKISGGSVKLSVWKTQGGSSLVEFNDSGAARLGIVIYESNSISSATVAQGYVDVTFSNGKGSAKFK